MSRPARAEEIKKIWKSLKRDILPDLFPNINNGCGLLEKYTRNPGLNTQRQGALQTVYPWMCEYFGENQVAPVTTLTDFSEIADDSIYARFPHNVYNQGVDLFSVDNTGHNACGHYPGSSADVWDAIADRIREERKILQG